MLIGFDVSNTRIGIGIFDGPELHASFALGTDVRRTADEYGVLLIGLLNEARLAREQIDGAAIASVVPPLTEAFEQLCSRLLGVPPLTVGAGTRTGIRIDTHNPREVGTDRIVNAVATHHLFGGPAIIVDFSTATAFDAVGPDGAYLGSAIAPGLTLSAEALFQHTSRLPRVDLVRPKSAIGKDTISALQSGLLFGHVAMVQGMLARMQVELGHHALVLATGELAPLIASEVAEIDRLEPHLTLIGLRLLYELNRVAV